MVGHSVTRDFELSVLQEMASVRSGAGGLRDTGGQTLVISVTDTVRLREGPGARPRSPQLPPRGAKLPERPRRRSRAPSRSRSRSPSCRPPRRSICHCCFLSLLPSSSSPLLVQSCCCRCNDDGKLCMVRQSHTHSSVAFSQDKPSQQQWFWWQDSGRQCRCWWRGQRFWWPDPRRQCRFWWWWQRFWWPDPSGNGNLHAQQKGYFCSRA